MSSGSEGSALIYWMMGKSTEWPSSWGGKCGMAIKPAIRLNVFVFVEKI